MKEIKNIELKHFTTLNIGGLCKHVFFPENEEEIRSILSQYDPIVLGCGSNVLINDEIVYDSAMVLTHFNKIYRVNNSVIAQAGARLMDVCLFAYSEGFGGLEFAYGIPGSVGGAIMMNAGAYGGEIKEVVSQVISTKKEYTNEECEFDYRHSIFTDSNECILQATFDLYPKEKSLIHMKMKELIDKRIEKQPLDQHSAGSTFKRGKDFYASQLINECNLKGYHVKDAMVSEKHAGFLINKKEASYQDFCQLIKDVQRIVYEKTNKKLECEVKIIGEKNDLCK